MEKIVCDKHKISTRILATKRFLSFISIINFYTLTLNSSVQCSTSDDRTVTPEEQKKIKFSHFNDCIGIDLNRIDTSTAKLLIPDIFTMTKYTNTCYFECFIFTILSDRAFCNYLRSTQFTAKQIISDALANILELVFIYENVSIDLCELYQLVLDVINSTRLRNEQLVIDSQMCLKEFLILAYDCIVTENELLFRDSTDANLISLVFPKINITQLQEDNTVVVTGSIYSYMHILMLDYNTSAMSMTQILNSIKNNILKNEYNYLYDFSFSSNTIRIFTNRFEIANAVKISDNKDNFHKMLKTYFAMCFRSGVWIYLLKSAVIYEPCTGNSKAGHYYTLFYSFEESKFYSMSKLNKVWIDNDEALDKLYEESLMVIYEKVAIKS